MEIKRENGGVQAAASAPEHQQPLLEKAPPEALKPTKTPGQKAIRKTFKGTAVLTKLLPTGAVLTFQILSPVLTFQGKCHTSLSRSLTLCLLTLCGLSCFLLCFTDSFRDPRGKVRYGFATIKGLWVLDASLKLPADEAAEYRLRFIDFFHAFLSVLVFGAVASFDKNVVKCFWPMPSQEVQELLVLLPVGVGVICSILILTFPTKRHGIGTPLSRC